jgi:hypothetical protein
MRYDAEQLDDQLKTSPKAGDLRREQSWLRLLFPKSTLTTTPLPIRGAVSHPEQPDDPAVTSWRGIENTSWDSWRVAMRAGRCCLAVDVRHRVIPDPDYPKRPLGPRNDRLLVLSPLSSFALHILVAQILHTSH